MSPVPESIGAAFEWIDGVLTRQGILGRAAHAGDPSQQQTDRIEKALADLEKICPGAYPAACLANESEVKRRILAAGDVVRQAQGNPFASVPLVGLQRKIADVVDRYVARQVQRFLEGAQFARDHKTPVGGTQGGDRTLLHSLDNAIAAMSFGRSATGKLRPEACRQLADGLNTLVSLKIAELRRAMEGTSAGGPAKRVIDGASGAVLSDEDDIKEKLRELARALSSAQTFSAAGKGIDEAYGRMADAMKELVLRATRDVNQLVAKLPDGAGSTQGGTRSADKDLLAEIHRLKALLEAEKAFGMQPDQAAEFSVLQAMTKLSVKAAQQVEIEFNDAGLPLPIRKQKVQESAQHLQLIEDHAKALGIEHGNKPKAERALRYLGDGIWIREDFAPSSSASGAGKGR